MDKKKIMEDGLLEQYLLGELDVNQHAQIEDALQKDNDLMDQYRAMEADFERMAFENAVEPPAQLRTSLQAALESTEDGNTKVRTLEASKEGNIGLKIRFMVAASLAALFALGSFWLYDKWQTSEENLQVLQQQTSDLQERLTSIEQDYKETNARYQTINNRNVVPLLLVGNQKLPDSRAVAYVNHNTKKVVVNPQGLPSLGSDKTYQMWADVDGVMIDMGVLPTDKELVDLAYIDNAESLNITIEPAGGNDHPTVENLISNVFL